MSWWYSPSIQLPTFVASTAFDWYPYLVLDAAEIIQALGSISNQLTLTIDVDEYSVP